MSRRKFSCIPRAILDVRAKDEGILGVARIARFGRFGLRMIPIDGTSASHALRFGIFVLMPGGHL